MIDAHRYRTLRIPLVMLLVLFQVPALAGPPAIVQRFDVRPDRGNVEDWAFVTGPACEIGRLDNADLEISFWNQLAEMTFSLAKNDVWDRRYFGDRKKIITVEDVRRVCFSGKIGRSSDLGLPNAPQALYHAYDFPCPKPVGQVIVRCPDLREHDAYVAGQAHNGTLVGKAANRGARAALWSFVHRTRNLLVVRGEYAGLTQPIEVQLYRHQDTTPQGTSIPALAHFRGITGYDYSQDPDNGPLPPPQAGSEGRIFWIRQAFPAEKTFPRGFECVFAALVDGAPCELKAADKVRGAGARFIVHPVDPQVYAKLEGYRKEIRIEAERMNNAESGSLATARIAGPAPSFTLYVAVVTTRDAPDPLAAAKNMLAEALREGADKIADESAATTVEAERAWRLSRVMHYNATSCSFADATPWHGDYHFNEVYLLESIVAGRTEQLDQLLLLFEQMRPALRRNAREVYNCGGICFPLVHYPIQHDRVVYGNVTWELGIENTALMLQPLWHRYQYTQDKDFLRTRAYPLMAEGARFYADYVKRGDDGYYHIIPTVSQEHWGLTPKFQLNRDSVGALSFARYHLKACIQASEILGIDAPQRQRWREIVAHLAPYPTLRTSEGPVFCDVCDAPRLLNYNNTANLIMVLWAEDISLDSPPDLLEMARRSYRAIPDKEHSWRKGYLRQIQLNLGILDKPLLSPQGRVLSWPGRIHLYAGVPQGASVNDSFTGLLAVGGFEVSAAHTGTDVRGVHIKSKVGGMCRVKSPWYPQQVKILNATGDDLVQHSMHGDTIVFETQAGDTYALLSGPELPRADLRFAAQEKLLGRWTFTRDASGVVADESGRGHVAKLVDGALLVVDGARKALQLVGPRSHAEVQRTPAFDFAANESFSVEARIKMAAPATADMIPIACSMAAKQYCLTLQKGAAKFYLSSPTGSVNCSASGQTVLTEGRWHTVRGVRDVAHGAVSLYVDGKLEGTAVDVTTGDFASDAPITIGAYLWGDHSRYGQGLIIGDIAIRSLGRMVRRP